MKGKATCLFLASCAALVIVIFTGQSNAEPMRVFRSILDLSQEGENSEARLVDARRVNVSSLTVCLRFNFKLLGSHLIRIDIVAEKEESPMQLLWFGAYSYSFFGFGFPHAHGSYKTGLLKDPTTNDFDVWRTNVWSHVCLAYSKANGIIRVFIDGKATNMNHADPAMTGVQIPADFLSNTVIGGSAAEGMLADFNVWDRALSEQELGDWTGCRLISKGNLVDFTSATFALINMTEESTTVESVCVPSRPGDVIFPEKRIFNAHFELCRKMRGFPTVVRSQKEQSALLTELKNHSDACGTQFWAGWWDVPLEGTFSSVNSARDVLTSSSFQPWSVGEPNGDVLESCVIVDGGIDSWNDVMCSFRVCGFCLLERIPHVQIRGLCEESLFNVMYSWTRTFQNGRHSFRGYTSTLFFWDPANQQWRLQHYREPHIFATINVTEYPFGTMVWDFSEDACYEGRGGIELSVNACDDEEFNCRDGNCVSMDVRCDGKVDCTDKTDEIGCEILLLDASNMVDFPASPDKSSTDDMSKSLTDVLVSLDLLSILDISEVDNLISLQLQLSLTWLDQRITMVNLKHDQDLNTLTPDFRKRIWIPQIVFYNTREKLESLNDDKAFATIRRNGSYTMSHKSQLQNAYFFRGAENPMTISRVYNSDFLCEFDMVVYPFDTQRCSVIVIMKGNSGKFARLVNDSHQYLGPIDLRQYFVKQTLFVNHKNMPDAATAVRVDIIFGRRILAPILTTYLPTILICVVSFGTNYFKALFFEAMVTVNLTCLLVLVTLFISVSDSLPKTSYIKMIDVWLIVNLFIPFSEVVLHTYIDSLRNKDRKVIKVVSPKVGQVDHRNEEDEIKEARKKLSTARRLRMATGIASTGLPLGFAAFVLGYFAMGMVYLYKDFGTG